MNQNFARIFSKLKRQDIFVDASSLKKHKHQGFMSTVHTVDSNKGTLVIHVIQPTQEWVRQRIWEKLIGVGNLLSKFREIPTSEFLFNGKIGSKYFVVQKKLEGKPAGKRTLINDTVVDIWFGKKAKIYIPQIQKIVARIHKIKRRGYGWPRAIDGEIRGQYKSWRKFFEKEVPLWLRSVSSGDSRLGKNNGELKSSFKIIKGLAYGIIKKIPYPPPFLIHGDAINPSNVLIQKDRVTGLLDWEWSIIGDPAWEFCDCGWWQLLNKKSLRSYFKEMGYKNIQIESFLKRARLYRLLWILWGAHMHAKDKNIVLYRTLRKMLSEESTMLNKPGRD